MKGLNNLNINGYDAVISFSSDMNMLRGEFIGLNGGADFYADNVRDLRVEGERSLDVFLQACEERGIEPKKTYSGKIMTRLPQDLHHQLAVMAEAKKMSLNAYIVDALSDQVSNEMA